VSIQKMQMCGCQWESESLRAAQAGLDVQTTGEPVQVPRDFDAGEAING
jgi:hypothetical protein